MNCRLSVAAPSLEWPRGVEVSAYTREPMCHSCSCVLLLPSWTSQKSSGMTYTHITPHAHIHTADTYTQHAHTQRHVSIPYTHTAHMYRHHTHAHHVSHIHIPHTAHTPTPRTYIPRTAHHTHARTHTHQSVQCPGTNSLGACCHLTDPPCCVLLPGSQVPELPSEPPAFLC